MKTDKVDGIKAFNGIQTGDAEVDDEEDEDEKTVQRWQQGTIRKKLMMNTCVI